MRAVAYKIWLVLGVLSAWTGAGSGSLARADFVGVAALQRLITPALFDELDAQQLVSGGSELVALSCLSADDAVPSQPLDGDDSVADLYLLFAHSPASGASQPTGGTSGGSGTVSGGQCLALVSRPEVRPSGPSEASLRNDVGLPPPPFLSSVFRPPRVAADTL